MMECDLFIYLFIIIIIIIYLYNIIQEYDGVLMATGSTPIVKNIFGLNKLNNIYNVDNLDSH